MSIKKNDVVTLDITALTSEGSGVGRINDMVVFVPNTAVGDKIQAKITKVLKKYTFARLEKIITPSENRIENDCPVFYKCGGCAYRHIDYKTELKEKANQVFHNIEVIAKIKDYRKSDCLCNLQKVSRYRNKGQFPIGISSQGKVVSGFFAPRSHRIIPVEDCKLQPKIFNKILSDCIDFFNQNNVSIYDETIHKGQIRHIYIRQGSVSGDIMVCFVVNGKTFTGINELCYMLADKYSQIKSIVLNVNTQKSNVILGEKCITLWGSDTITDELCGLKIKLSPLSFYQINHDMAEKIYLLAGELADFDGSETLLDLYCGAGLIGLSVANKVRKVIGIEIIEQAVQNAKQNAELNGIKNVEFYCSDASLVKKLIDGGERIDVAFVDPPRKGLSLDVIDALCDSNAKKIIYISCNSSTLSRDLQLISQRGYQLISATPADLFPRTIHCETVVLLCKEKPQNN